MLKEETNIVIQINGKKGVGSNKPNINEENSWNNEEWWENNEIFNQKIKKKIYIRDKLWNNSLNA